MLRQKSAVDCSHRTNTWRTVADVGSVKYGKSMFEAKKRLCASGDIRNVANGHSTAISTARKLTPPNKAHCHLGASLKSGASRSSSNAGATSSMGNGRGTMCVIG